MSDAPQNPHEGADEASKQEKPLLVIHNFHNPHYGEQWVFVYDYDSETGIVRGGDAGWENIYSVVDGRARGLSLSVEEKVWLYICWYEATARKEGREKIRAGTRR